LKNKIAFAHAAQGKRYNDYLKTAQRMAELLEG
jgi:hypothetical protein